MVYLIEVGVEFIMIFVFGEFVDVGEWYFGFGEGVDFD